MEIQLTSQKRDSKASDPGSPMIKEVDDFPTFDEVFDRESLRKFFREQDSGSLHSIYSPQKDLSLADETRSLGEERDLQLSPNNEVQSKSHNPTPRNKSHLSFSFNFNSNPKIFEVKRLVRGSSNLSPQSGSSASTQASSGSPINPSPIRNSDFHRLGPKSASFTTAKASNTELPLKTSYSLNYSNENQALGQRFSNIGQNSFYQPETNFQRLVREKRVFRIIRNQKPVTKRTSKRKPSMPIDEFLPASKQLNTQSTYQLNFYNSPTLVSRTPSQNQNTPPFSDISNYFGNVPNTQTQYNNMYPLQNVNHYQSYEPVNYLFNSSQY